MPVSQHRPWRYNSFSLFLFGTKTPLGNGFGESMAKAFAREGCTVIVADILADRGKRVVAEITQQSKESDKYGSSHFVEFDCTSRSSWEELLTETLRVAGKLDIIVNNAGTTYQRKTSMEVSSDEFAKMMAVNCTSIYLSTSVIMPYLVKNGGGVVLNMSSTAGLHAPKGQVLYAGSKAFVNMVGEVVKLYMKIC